MDVELLSEHRCHGGVQSFHRHTSRTIGLPMRFSVFQPPQSQSGKVPVLFYLAGLTGNEETFAIKAGAQQHAARLGLMLVTCDTSPRQTGIVAESDDWEFGSGAGFYLNATRAPWSQFYRMYDYVRDELRELILAHFPARPDRIGIFGHSMGGHGALTLAVRNPHIYRSVSAFAPICAAARSPWGRKAFSHFLGDGPTAWEPYDAAALIERAGRALWPEILVDQGLADKFLSQGQLLPELLEAACRQSGQPLQLRRHPGYDHNYYFIQSFIADHLNWHSQQFAASQQT